MDLSPVPITPENDPNSRFSQEPVPVVYVQGTHREMGRQIGQGRRAAVVEEGGIVNAAEGLGMDALRGR